MRLPTTWSTGERRRSSTSPPRAGRAHATALACSSSRPPSRSSSGAGCGRRPGLSSGRGDRRRKTKGERRKSEGRTKAFSVLKPLRWLLWYPLLAAIAALVLLQIWFVVHIGYWASHNPETTAFMEARLEK